MVMIASALPHAAAIVSAATPPLPASLPASEGTASKPATSWPALTRLAAIGKPMLPSPMKPMRAIGTSCRSSLVFARGEQRQDEIGQDRNHARRHNDQVGAVDLIEEQLDHDHR